MLAFQALFLATLLAVGTSRIEPSSCSLHGVYKACHCFKLVYEATEVICRGQKWSHALPALPQREPRIRTLVVTDSDVTMLSGMTFAGHNVVNLSMSHNQIDYIDPKAFLGLENKLVNLRLDKNKLERIPLEAIGRMYRLQYLWLTHNRLGNIKPHAFRDQALSHLRFLHLDHNGVTFVANGVFADLNLDTLTMSHNRIHAIADRGLSKNLRYLKLSFNQLREAPFAAIADSQRTLEYFDLSENNITHLISPLEQLKFEKNFTLLLKGNRIGTLHNGALKNFPFLEKLDLSFNEIHRIHRYSFSGVKFLKKLDLSFNRIFIIDSQSLIKFHASLQDLNLEDNILSQIPTTLKHAHALLKLNVRMNIIRNIDPKITDKLSYTINTFSMSHNQLHQVPKAAIERMPHLRSLDLSQNRIAKLPAFAFASQDSANSLAELQLSGNKLVAINEPMAFASLTTVAYLDLSYNELEYLTANAFYLLTGLEKIFLQNNRLRNVPLAALGRLRNVRDFVLDNNLISVLPSFESPSLKHLSLANNRITAVANGTFPPSLEKLVSVHLSGNRISYLSRYAFSRLRRLRLISLANNWLRTIHPLTFHDLPNTEVIDLSWNQIRNISKFAFMNIDRLQVLIFDHNELTDLPDDFIIGSHRLEEIDFSYNQLDRFRAAWFEKMKALARLDFRHNRLVDIREMRNMKRSAKEIYLSNNRIRNVGENNFGEFSELTHIDLSNNEINSLSPTAFDSTKKLTWISLARNKLMLILKSSFLDQTFIRFLDLSYNRIEKMEEGTFGSGNIERLLLSHNRLTNVPFDTLSSISHSLKTLDVSYNPIADLGPWINWRTFKALETLNISHMWIKVIDANAFAGLSNLQRLDLSGNNVHRWHKEAFANISRFLKIVDVSKMNLARLPSLGGARLQLLNMSGNMMSGLHADSFSGIESLQNLDISHNRIVEIAPSTFARFKYLKHLNLSFNPLVQLHSSVFRQISNLETLDVSNMKSLRLFDTKLFLYLPVLKNLQLHHIPLMEDEPWENAFHMVPPLHKLHIELNSRPQISDQLSRLNLRKMRHLHVSGHKIRSIAPEAFQGLKMFKVRISITDTQITDLPQFMFESFRFVSYLTLDLRGNQIRSFNPFQYSERVPIISRRNVLLLGLNLGGNPLECDCRFNWLKSWFKALRHGSLPGAYMAHIDRWQDTYCHAPDNTQGLPMLQVLDAMQCAAGTCYGCALALCQIVLGALLVYYSG